MLNVPTLVRFGIAVISSSKYAARSVTATCFIVPPSLTITRSASAIVVEEALVSPSNIFNSVAVVLTPSSLFNSVAEAVTAASFVKSACTNPDTLFSKLISSALEVTAASFVKSA